MKNFSKLLTAALMMCLLLPLNSVRAATTVGVPTYVKVSSGNYYRCWNKHRKELERAGFTEGNGNDAYVTWKKVKGASGYQIRLIWNTEMGKSTTTVNVKKSGKKYIYKKTGSSYLNPIAPSAKYSITHPYIDKTKFVSKKLAVYVDASGSDPYIHKVKIRAYKMINGKKKYGKYKTVTKIKAY